MGTVHNIFQNSQEIPNQAETFLRGNYSKFQKWAEPKFGSSYRALSKTGLGQAFSMSAKQMAGFGFEHVDPNAGFIKSLGYKNMKSTGFLGKKAGLETYEKLMSGGIEGKIAKYAMKSRKTALAYSYGKAALGPLTMLGFTAYSAYEGYKQGGVWGAAKEVGSSTIDMAMFTYGFGVVGGALPFALAGLGAAAVGYAGYEVGEAMRRKAKKMKRTEFIGENMPDVLRTSGVATARQRSLLALQNTHVNSRMVLGGEAQLLHQ